LSYVEKLKEEITKAEAARELFLSQLRIIQNETRNKAVLLIDVFRMEEILRSKLSEQDSRIKYLRADLEKFKEQE
jgi:hypothetical protein